VPCCALVPLGGRHGVLPGAPSQHAAVGGTSGAVRHCGSGQALVAVLICCAVLCWELAAGVGLFLGLPFNTLLWGALVVPFVTVGLVSRFWPRVRSTFVGWKERLQRRWKQTVSDPGKGPVVE
jgi:hypothetical protein